MDLVSVSYHHLIAPLVGKAVLRKEIQLHKLIYPQAWGESSSYSIDPPNESDQINPPQGYYNSIFISRGVTVHNCPPFAYQPHWAKYVDPQTGEEYRIIIVPAAQAMGWKDGYALYGTEDIDAIAPYNDPDHPMLIVLGHDGDNAFGGGYSYYMESVTNFVQIFPL